MTDSHSVSLRPVWPFFLVACLLLLGILHLPYGYYSVLRLAVVGAAVYGIVTGPGELKGIRIALFGILAVPWMFFNLHREEWLPLDLGASGVFLACSLGYRVADLRRRATLRKAGRQAGELTRLQRRTRTHV